jgi:hypothetical protein
LSWRPRRRLVLQVAVDEHAAPPLPLDQPHGFIGVALAEKEKRDVRALLRERHRAAWPIPLSPPVTTMALPLSLPAALYARSREGLGLQVCCWFPAAGSGAARKSFGMVGFAG